MIFRDTTQIYKKFDNVEPTKKETIEDKLKKRLAELKNARKYSDVEVQGTMPMFIQFLDDSQGKIIRCYGEICTESGIKHDITLDFDDGQCSVKSNANLFPTPLYVIKDAIETNDNIISVQDFFNILNVIKVFDGKNVSFDKKK